MPQTGTCIRLALRHEASLVQELRRQCYANSSDFLTNSNVHELVNWNKDDEASQVLTVWDDNKLIATMRVEILSDWFHARLAFDGCTPPIDHRSWPALNLARGSTLIDLRKSGLNSLMRYYALEAALEAGYERLYGYVAVGGMRTRFMQEMGYQFYYAREGHSQLPSQYRWAIAWLDLSTHGEQALQILKDRLQTELRDFPWIGARIHFPDRDQKLSVTAAHP